VRALVFAPGKAAAEVDYDGRLETLQRFVGGYIEAMAKGGSLPRGCVGYVNEDGCGLALPLNRGHYGTIVVVGVDRDGLEVALTDEQIAEILGAVG
jgi:hypothetical protein